MATSVTGEVDVVDLFGPSTGNGRLPPQDGARASVSSIAAVERHAPRPSPNGDGAEVPQWLRSKIDEYITEQFYQIEARISRIEKQVCEVTLVPQKRDDQVSEVFQQVKTLIELQFAEVKKGVGRDRERQVMAEQFDMLIKEVHGQHVHNLECVRKEVEAVRNDMEGHGSFIESHVEGCMMKRNDAMALFEADLMAIKKSFGSLRLEFQKLKKGQEFKNCSTSVFLVKAMDMKPDERKTILRTLSEQEDRCRGAVTKTESDLRDHEKEIQRDKRSVVS